MSSRIVSAQPIRVCLISLEAVREGTAASQHLRAIGDAIDGSSKISMVSKLSSPAPGRSGVRRLIQLVSHQLAQFVAVANADVVYSRWHVLSAPTILIARALGKPTVLEVNGTWEDILVAHPGAELLRPLVISLGRIQFRLASKIITVTEGLKEWVNSESPKSEVIALTNGANSELSSLVAETSDPMRVVFFGELAVWQGIDVALKAKSLPEWPRHVVLEVVGSGAMEGIVRAAALADPEIVYRGRLSQHELHERVRFAAATLSVQSGNVSRNRFGVAPLKVAESLMLGTPVVISDLGGHSDILKRVGYEWVVPADSAESVARCVRSIVEAHGSGRIDRATISGIAREYLSWESVGRETVRVISGLVAGPPGTAGGSSRSGSKAE